jgi:hypothetical protein
VKPVHFANGLFRAVCGHSASADLLRKAGAGIRRGTNRISTALFIADARDRFEDVDGMDTTNRVQELRSALDLVLHQDRAFFANGPCSPTSTYFTQTHSDPSDQHTGDFVAQLLAATEDGTAVLILRKALSRGTDNLFLLTAPLLEDHPIGTVPEATAEMVTLVAGSPLLQSIGSAFARVMAYENFLEKTAFLQRTVTLGSFTLFLQLINQVRAGDSDRQSERVPILLCAPSSSAEIREASRATFALARQHTERGFELGLARELRSRGEDRLTKEEYVGLARSWVPSLGESGRNGSRDGKIWNRFAQDFESFRLVAAHPADAFQTAAVRAAFVAMNEYSGEDPEGFGASIGRMTGLVYPRQQGGGDKYYLPAPQFLDMLVTSLLSPDEEIPVEEFWSRAECTFGVLCGARRNLDSSRLSAWHIGQISPSHLDANSRAMTDELIRMGYAREYADDIAMVRAGGHHE